MPTTVGPNTFGEENLVFGYDLGDSVNSYKGEPATNSQPYDQSAMTSTGFDGWGCYDGTNSTPAYHSWDVAQSKTLVNIPGPFRKNVNAMLYHNFTGGFHGPTHWSGIPGSALTANTSITVQGWVKAADAASVGKTVTPYIYYYLSGGGAASSSTNFTLTSEWQLVSHTHNITTAGTSGILYFFTSGGTNIKMYLTMTGAIPNKGHAVPWLAGGQTRSATQGLIDLTGNSTIDLTNVSFDSNAQMTFDGSDDQILLDSYASVIPYGASANITVEAFVRWNDLVPNGVIVSYGGNAANSGFLFQVEFSQGLEFSLFDGAGHNGRASLLTAPSAQYEDEYIHMVGTYDGSIIRLYINGTQLASQTYTYGYPQQSYFRLGNEYNRSYYANIDLPVLKIYNRALTASEVASNYKAIKSRFNI